MRTTSVAWRMLAMPPRIEAIHFIERRCQAYMISVEDYLARHPGELPIEVPAELGTHGLRCPQCRGHWATAYCSRILLARLSAAGEPSPTRYFQHAARVLA